MHTYYSFSTTLTKDLILLAHMEQWKDKDAASLGSLIHLYAYKMYTHNCIDWEKLVKCVLQRLRSLLAWWLYCLLTLVSYEVRVYFFRLCCLEMEPGYALGHIFAASFVLLLLTFPSLLRALFMDSVKISPHLTLFAYHHLVYRLLPCSCPRLCDPCKVHLPVPSL